MKKIVAILLTALVFIGCSSKGASNIEPKIVVGKSLNTLTLNDQNGKKHSIKNDTKIVIFAFSKDAAHTCNDYFNEQSPDYLEKHHTQFIADVSSAPSFIRSMFIMPGLKDFKHTVMIFEDKENASGYRAGQDNEKIVVVYLNNKSISSIKTISTAKELELL